MLIEPEDEGDEHFVDAPEEGQPAAGSSKTASAVNDKVYDGKKREPQYAHADTSCLWELVSHLFLMQRPNSLMLTR
jgi:ribosome biogenesis protein MAK21